MPHVRPALVLLALTLTATAAAAENQVGVIAGFNLATLSIEGSSRTDPRGSFAAGGVVDIAISDRFGIRVEPMFMSKGGESTERNVYWGSNDGAVFQLDCINVPVLARFDLGASEARSYLLGGFGVSFATESKVEISQANYKETVDFGDVLNPMDVSLDLGAGISFPVGDANRMSFDARVAIGLMDINDGGTVTFNGSPLTVPSTSTHTLDFRMFGTYLFPWP